MCFCCSMIIYLTGNQAAVFMSNSLLLLLGFQELMTVMLYKVLRYVCSIISVNFLFCLVVLLLNYFIKKLIKIKKLLIQWFHFPFNSLLLVWVDYRRTIIGTYPKFFFFPFLLFHMHKYKVYLKLLFYMGEAFHLLNQCNIPK